MDGPMIFFLRQYFSISESFCFGSICSHRITEVNLAENIKIYKCIWLFAQNECRLIYWVLASSATVFACWVFNFHINSFRIQSTFQQFPTFNRYRQIYLMWTLWTQYMFAFRFSPLLSSTRYTIKFSVNLCENRFCINVCSIRYFLMSYFVMFGLNGENRFKWMNKTVLLWCMATAIFRYCLYG